MKSYHAGLFIRPSKLQDYADVRTISDVGNSADLIRFIKDVLKKYPETTINLEITHYTRICVEPTDRSTPQQLIELAS
jgi:hypothetical protein